MLQLENNTPFAAGIHVFPDPCAVDTLYVVVKATFLFGTSHPEVAPEQVPLCLADQYTGEPGASSLKYPCEAHPSKASTDVILVGCAQAPNQRRVTKLTATVRVGSVARELRVLGDRRWTGSWIGRAFSEPDAFEKMPLVWERAFGGVHLAGGDSRQIYAEERNPVGRGFRGKQSRHELKGQLLPNLEDPRDLLEKPGDTPEPAGVGCIAPAWQPRRSYAGTYDEAWQQRRAPYLPHDFNVRFFNCAAPALVCPDYLTGGELVELRNLSPRGPLRFLLPRCEFELSVRVASRSESPRLCLETVLLEPEDERFELVWRAALPCDKQVLKVERIRIELRQTAVGGAATA